MPIKLYTAPEHYHARFRTYLHPLLKPFIGKPKTFTDAERHAMYGLGEDDFELTDNVRKAQIAVLPMAWNYYLRHCQQTEAMTFYERCRKAGLTVFTWNAGDFGVKVPELEGIIVHRPNGYRSQLPSNHRGMPVFISDPLPRFFNRDEPIFREKGARPVVGFCGQAAGNLLKYTTDVLRTTWRNARFHLGLSYEEPQLWYPSTLLRNRILCGLERDDRIETNFIKRRKYRAGAKTEEEHHKTTLEFYQNMVESDYIVCVRGGGIFPYVFMRPWPWGEFLSLSIQIVYCL